MLVGLQHGRPRLHVREEAAADEEAVLGERPELRLFHDLVEERALARGAAMGGHEVFTNGYLVSCFRQRIKASPPPGVPRGTRPP